MPIKKIINKKLGELLVERKIITTSQLEEALNYQKEYGGLIGEIIVKLGFAKEEDIAQVLTIQYGFPFLSLANYEISEEIISLIPERVARQYLVIPLDKIENSLSVAMADPLNTSAIEDIEFLTGCHIQIFVTTPSDIREAINRYYRKQNGKP